MTTNSTDSTSSKGKSWEALAKEAAVEAAPADIDIRIGLRAQLEALPQTQDSKESGIWNELLALWERNWFRASLAGCSVLVVGLAAGGVVALQEFQDYLHLAGPLTF